MLEIRTPQLRRLYDEWETKRGPRALPARRDFDVLDLKYVIGRLSLLDVSREPLRFRFRLHGSRIAQQVGYEMTGKDLDNFPQPAVRQLMFDHFSRVVAERTPRVELRERHIKDERIVVSEVLVLPLARDGEAVDMLMVGVGFH